MSFRRELAKALLAEVVSSASANRAAQLRDAARQDPPGFYRDSKRAVAQVADEISQDPKPVVDLIEAMWDGPNHRRRGQ